MAMVIKGWGSAHGDANLSANYVALIRPLCLIRSKTTKDKKKETFAIQKSPTLDFICFDPLHMCWQQALPP